MQYNERPHNIDFKQERVWRERDREKERGRDTEREKEILNNMEFEHYYIYRCNIKINPYLVTLC